MYRRKIIKRKEFNQRYQITIIYGNRPKSNGQMGWDEMGWDADAWSNCNGANVQFAMGVCVCVSDYNRTK